MDVEPCPGPPGAHARMGMAGETRTEEGHLSDRPGADHCPKCRTQTLILPTGNSPSTGRGGHINKILYR